MSENRKDYGILLTPEIKLHRQYFNEMVKLLGINCIYRAPLPGKTFGVHGDLDSNYQKGEIVGVILTCSVILQHFIVEK